MMPYSLKDKSVGAVCMPKCAQWTLWVCSYHMNTEEQLSEALSLMFQYEVVSLSMVMDGSKEQIFSQLCCYFVNFQCHQKQTESYSP